MFLYMDSIVYEWNSPKLNPPFAALKKSSINPLIGFKSFQLSTLFNKIIFKLLISFFSLFKFFISLKEDNG